MSTTLVRRAGITCFASLALVLLLNACTPGPPGPAGPSGPPGGSAGGGPPYTWICTPINYANAGSTNGTLHVFNGSSATANVAVNFLNKDGLNLAGAVVPGAVTPGATYPGQSGASTVPVLSANTLIVNWETAQGVPAAGGNIPTSIRVTSDQPIAVGTNIVFSGFHAVPCSFVHR